MECHNVFMLLKATCCDMHFSKGTCRHHGRERPLAQTDRSTVSKRIGMQLKVAREANYLTQSAVARQLGLSRGGWSMYESGKRMVDIEVVIKFCKLCTVDAN